MCCAGGSDISISTEDAGLSERSTASQGETVKPTRVSGGSIFSRFRMCPVAETGSAAASVQSTSSEPQASCDPPCSLQERLPQDLINHRPVDTQGLRYPPRQRTVSLSSLGVRSTDAFAAHDMRLSPVPSGGWAQQTLDSRRRASDLLQFSLTPPSAKRQKQTHEGLRNDPFPVAGVSAAHRLLPWYCWPYETIQTGN